MVYEYVAAFNDEVEKIIQIVSYRFPDDSGVQRSRDLLQIANVMSPKKAALNFMEYALQYGKEIDKRDDRFFLSKSREIPDLDNLDIGRKWATFSDKEKDAIWVGVQTMFALGNLIVANST
jgi:hypothetical protein